MSSWLGVLTQLEPEYDKLSQLMDSPLKISAELTKKNFKWCVRIHEDWNKTAAEYQYAYYVDSDEKLKECIRWTNQNLSTWSFVTRASYDRWYFLRKRDAEKFITLFNLQWIT